MTPHTLFTAICNVKKMPLQEALAQDKVWLHTTNDIFMVSTPEQVRARSYAQITLIPISMSSTDATAYLALPNGAVRDVIHMTHNAAQVHSYHRLGVQPEAGRGRTTEFSFPKSDRVQLAKTAMANKMSEDAGAAVHEEEMRVCLILRSLEYPNRLRELEPLFGRHYSAISSATNAVLADIESTFVYLLQDLNNSF
ncbi:uncharacterized protein [Dermacentor albipictus]|uniref:uncharacterized protein isoform X2 n=1 Tax=Dermacentor albipictus TaxID=60249 RepID=UPI0038FD3124